MNLEELQAGRCVAHVDLDGPCDGVSWIAFAARLVVPAHASLVCCSLLRPGGGETISKPQGEAGCSRPGAGTIEKKPYSKAGHTSCMPLVLRTASNPCCSTTPTAT